MPFLVNPQCKNSPRGIHPCNCLNWLIAWETPKTQSEILVDPRVNNKIIRELVPPFKRLCMITVQWCPLTPPHTGEQHFVLQSNAWIWDITWVCCDWEVILFGFVPCRRWGRNSFPPKKNKFHETPGPSGMQSSSDPHGKPYNFHSILSQKKMESAGQSQYPVAFSGQRQHDHAFAPWLSGCPGGKELGLEKRYIYIYKTDTYPMSLWSSFTSTFAICTIMHHRHCHHPKSLSWPLLHVQHGQHWHYLQHCRHHDPSPWDSRTLNYECQGDHQHHNHQLHSHNNQQSSSKCHVVTIVLSFLITNARPAWSSPS